MLVEPDWPPLTLGEARDVLAGFPGFGEPIEILSVSPRPFSAASIVGTRGGRVLVKRHHWLVRDCEGLLEEHRFIEHLRAHGVPVTRVIASISGETAVSLSEWTYEVHEVAAGVDLYSDAHSWTPFQSVGHAYAAGRALAQLHCAARGFDAPARAQRPLVASFTIFADRDPETQMSRYIQGRPALADEKTVASACCRTLDLLAPFHAELQPLLPALDSMWTHNDLHASNLFWSHHSAYARTAAIIDFGLADRTNAVHDLALAIERNIVEWLSLTDGSSRQRTVPVHLEELRALLAGYESVRPLSREEAAALAPMTALCHAEFALSEADYFLGVLHSKEKTRMAVPDYLVGHAEWFHSPEGAGLLDCIRAWARDSSRGVRTR